MIRTLLPLFILTVVFFVPPGWAHPPQDIQLDYDLTAGLLHVSMKHVTVDPREHRIRKIVVYLNGEEVQEHYYVQQTSADGLKVDIELQAQPGDEISIKAICSKAGFSQARFIIPDE